MPEPIYLTAQQVEEGEKLLEEGINAVKQGAYDVAIVRLEGALSKLEDKEKKADALFYLSISYFALNQMNKPKELLTEMFKLNPKIEPKAELCSPKYLALWNEVKGETIKNEKKPQVAVTPLEKKLEVKKGKGWLWILLGGAAAAVAAILLTRGGEKTTATGTLTTTNTTTTIPSGGNQQPKTVDLQGPTSCKWGDKVEYKAKGNDPDGEKVSINFWIKDVQRGSEWELGWSSFVNNNAWVKKSITWDKSKYSCGSSKCQYRIRAKCKDEGGRESNPMRLNVWVEPKITITSTTTTVLGPTPTTTTTTSLSTTTTVSANRPPSNPKISGPKEVYWNHTYTYTFLSYDSDADRIQYHIEGGESIEGGGSKYISSWKKSGEPMKIKIKFHFTMLGNIETIRARACDEKGACSKESTYKVNVW
jgi:hypothetical protein